MIVAGVRYYHEDKYKVFPFSPGWPKFCYPTKDLMTELDSHAPGQTSPPKRDTHFNTLIP